MGEDNIKTVQLVSLKYGSKFLLTTLNVILKTIKGNEGDYKTMDRGKYNVCHFWETASICAFVGKKQNAKGHIVYITFRSDGAGSNLMFFIDTETRTVYSNSVILTFLMKSPTKAPFILKTLDDLKEFIEELIEAIPTDEDQLMKAINEVENMKHNQRNL
ncbi:MAG: hypothetical protein QXP62_06110 [Saccharolobus sp.]